MQELVREFAPAEFAQDLFDVAGGSPLLGGKAGGVEDLQLLYAVGRGLADNNSWPQWRANAEFRAARTSLNRRRGTPPATSEEAK